MTKKSREQRQAKILPTPNLAKNNCHEIKQINLF